MLASIVRRPAYSLSFIHSPIVLGASLKRTASAVGWGVAIGAGTMLVEFVAVVGALYAAGIIDL